MFVIADHSEDASRPFDGLHLGLVGRSSQGVAEASASNRRSNDAAQNSTLSI